MSKDRFTFAVIEKGVSPIITFGDKSMAARKISTDTRKIDSGAFFIALSGENFDGHDYIMMALDHGAKGVMVSETRHLREMIDHYPGTAAFVVEDTTKALQDLSAYWKEKQNPYTYAITGSNGKTSTKEILHAILNATEPTLKTEGNLNNLIGLPLTLLKLEDEKLAVVEMGMNALGEIERLAEIAKPDIGIITNVNTAHLQYLGDLDSIAKAKGELFDALTEDNWAIVNIDNKYTVQLGEKCKAKKKTFSMENPEADVYATKIARHNGGYDVTASLEGKEIDVYLPLVGRHNVANMLAAMTAALAGGITPEQMAKGIPNTVVPDHRLKIMYDIPEHIIIDDCYNANPESMEAALYLLGEVEDDYRKVAIMGDMLELGKNSDKYHEELGEKVFKNEVDELIVFGEFSESTQKGAIKAGMNKEKVFAANNWEDIAKRIGERIVKGDAVLIKGSRGCKMERAISDISKINRD